MPASGWRRCPIAIFLYLDHQPRASGRRRADGLAGVRGIKKGMPKSSKSSRKPPSEAAKALQPRAPSAAKISVKSLHAETKAAPRGPRRAIFIDVENTSSETALIAALDQLQVDRALTPTELVAVGNWRVIGHH
ncbi:MAG: hypothetical protein ACREQQ_08005, partial [Candidatus Binatia bacterium]